MDEKQLLNNILLAQKRAAEFIGKQTKLIALLVGFAPTQVVEFPELDVMHVYSTPFGAKVGTPNEYTLRIGETSATWVGGQHPWGGKLRDITVDLQGDTK